MWTCRRSFHHHAKMFSNNKPRLAGLCLVAFNLPELAAL